jgi:hypothetical protein
MRQMQAISDRSNDDASQQAGMRRMPR